MLFENIRVKKINAIIHYRATMKKWTAKNRADHILGIILDGSTFHDFGYKQFVLSRNCIYFFNQRDNYEAIKQESGLSFSIHFTTYEDIDTDSFCIPISNPNEIVTLLNKTKQAKESNNELSALSFLYMTLDKYKNIYDKAYSRIDPRISNAKTYIDQNFNKPDCLENAVNATNLTARRFGEIFRNTYEKTPNKYIVKCKIERAKELLLTHNFSINDIAEICGFSDVYYFSKTFKKETGISPSRFSASEKNQVKNIVTN
ncbi:MAG: helix-turn-helix transcriptional regulator [Clostridiales bacterium]|nr:helix-turn-helix transcriptional regulator [Clostridiales bacterium]